MNYSKILFSIMGALIISQRVFGFTTRFGKLVEPGKETFDSTSGIRALTFDKIMKKYLDEMEQIVIAHTTIVFFRYFMLALESRECKDDRTAGELFNLHCDELEDITLNEAILLILDFLKWL